MEANGTNGTIGTAFEIEERIAMALEGGVPALYAPALAEMQVMVRERFGKHMGSVLPWAAPE